MIYTALTISFGKIITLFSLTTIGGLFLAMITNSNRVWWQINFSFLGTQRAVNNWQFNLTLILSALLMLTLTDYIFGEIASHQLEHHEYTKLTILRLLFVLVCLSLGLIGGFENVRGTWRHIAHDLAAKAMVVLMLSIIIALKWIVPKISKEFLVLSYTFGGFMIAIIILFIGVHYLSLTAFEIIGYGLGFTWLVLFLQNLKQAFIKEKTYTLELSDNQFLIKERETPIV
jgi:hypothetical membrane protein